MSDDEGLFFSPGTDPEYARMLTDVVSRRRMAYTDASHGLFSFLRDLPDDKKKSLRAILASIRTADNPAALADFYVGLLSGYLDIMHGLCPTCDTNHGDELSAMLEAPPEAP